MVFSRSGWLNRLDRRSRKFWARHRQGDVCGFQAYLAMDETSHRLVAEVRACVPHSQSAILDLGCNVGRHLNALAEQGYENLNGVDINPQAIQSAADHFPRLRKSAQLTCGEVETFLPSCETSAYELLFARDVVECFPLGFPYAREMARIVRRWVILVTLETGGSFPRMWEWEFFRSGMVLTKLLRPVAPGSNRSLMVFQKRKGQKK